MVGAAPALAGRRVLPVAGFQGAAVGLAAASALLAGWAPLGLSIVSVFLFAGPHNWLEARYFLGRLPRAWGPLRAFFLFGFGGVAVLATSFALLPGLAGARGWSPARFGLAAGAWNTALVLWILALALARSRTAPRRDWSWLPAVAFALIGVAWLRPQLAGVAIVYLHPLVALWILDRELRRSRPEWLAAYRRALATVPVLLALLWWHLADAPDLPGTDLLAARIGGQAGAGVLAGVSTHLLVATHTFLETLHYGVWVAAIPVVGLRSAPWSLARIPLAGRAGAWRLGIMLVLALGALLVLALWGGFLADYPRTRDIYFTVAVVHVLAEVPFLLRAL